MKPLLLLIAILLVIAAGVLAVHLRSRRSTPGAVAHVENGFEFTVHAPYEKVFPLFGAHGERTWAEG